MDEPVTPSGSPRFNATPAGHAVRVAQLTASPFLGGPERQMLGLASSLGESCRTTFLGFTEGGKAEPLLNEARRCGFPTIALQHNLDGLGRGLRAAVGEVAGHLRAIGAEVVCCHGYKPDLVGWLAARRVGIPVVAVSRGWTAATLKVRLNEALDRICLRRMDRVVCVSEGQAVKVRRAGVDPSRVIVCRNAIHADRFTAPPPEGRATLLGLFERPPHRVVGAAGRLSPEKGFADLIEAAWIGLPTAGDVGFVIFGDGPLRTDLAGRIEAAGLSDRFRLAGFRADLDTLIPHLDLVVLPSYTEGLPNVILEALAAGVPVVATAVGGTPEVVDDGRDGRLVPPREPATLSRCIFELIGDDASRRTMGQHGRERIRADFTFEAQARQYREVFHGLIQGRAVPA